jgi:peptidoglycan/xylan/chitin deacetylase (PgdA/CDA1 family)
MRRAEDGGDQRGRGRALSGVAGVAGVAAAAALTHFLPSVCVLGQWSPLAVRALPGGLCRWRGPATAPAVALTLDDGPSPRTTPRTLALLEELGLVATFFVVGSLVEAHPELVSEIRRRGHGIASHGYRHEHHLLRGPGWVRRDTAAAVSGLEALGVRPRFYRPPYGQLTARTLVEVRRHAMEVVLWSAWGREWAEPDADAVMARLSSRLEPGAILLLHDSDEIPPPGKAELTWRTLEMLAPALQQRSLRSVDLDTLLSAGPAEPPSTPA